MDTMPNSQVRQRAVMASGALSDTEGGLMVDWSRLWLSAAPQTPRASNRLRFSNLACFLTAVDHPR